MIYKIIFSSILSHSILSTQTSANRVVYIYAGPGASKQSLIQTVSAIEPFVQNYEIRYLFPEQLITENWEKEAALLIVPGGADTPYTRALNGAGNQKIRSYVEKGGSFLGICAGSYYSGAYVDFGKGTPLEVQGDRELSLFPGIVRGPALAAYDYQNESGARAATITWKDTSGLQKGDLFTVYYNGGGYFVDASTKDRTTVLASYEGEGEFPAIIECRVGAGKAILSGVHFEYDPELMDAHDSHLQHIIPKLNNKNSKRIELVEHLLKRLNLQCSQAPAVVGM